MEHLELTFQFDNIEQTLTRFNGLSINQLGKFLNGLSKTLSSDENSVVLSEIKGNCYAPILTTTSPTQFEKIKTLHSVIAEGRFSSLTKQEKQYARILSDLVSDGLILNVYDRQKSFFKTIEKFSPEMSYPYYFETNSVIGVITRIGSRNIETKNTIIISSYPLEIEINAQQESILKNLYKADVIEFYMTEKINKDTNKAESSVLDHFHVIKDNQGFYKEMLMLRENHGSYFSNSNEHDGE